MSLSRRYGIINIAYHGSFHDGKELYTMSNVKRKDSKNRNLRNGESQRKDGRYVYKYTDIYGKPQFIYSFHENVNRKDSKNRNLRNGETEKTEIRKATIYLFLETCTDRQDTCWKA